MEDRVTILCKRTMNKLTANGQFDEVYLQEHPRSYAPTLRQCSSLRVVCPIASVLPLPALIPFHTRAAPIGEGKELKHR